MDKKVNTPRKKVAVWRYNHAKYSNKSYIDLTKVVAIDELEEGNEIFNVYFDNAIWRVEARCYMELFNAWMAL